MKIALISLPYSNDVARWGGAKGPQAFLDAGLEAALRARGHRVGKPCTVELPRAKRERDTINNLGYLSARISDAVADALEREEFPIVMEGNCTGCVGPTGGLARALGSAGIVWYDAHGDIHTMKTTGTGLLGGMPFAVCLGWEFDDWRERAGLRVPVPPSAVALIGASDLDPEEVEALTTHKIARLDAADMMQDGGRKTARLLKGLAKKAAGWYLHFDMDVCGTDAVPGAHTPAPHWPPSAELLASVAAAAKTVPVRCFGLAAYDPTGDPERKGARLGIEIVCAAIDAIT